jgi:hypothetical protein
MTHSSRFAGLAALLTAWLWLTFLPAGHTATYYVSNTGSDSNVGTSKSAPWQTINKVNTTTFSAGSSILFQGGHTFSGNITMNESGTSTAPITIGSYGTGDATINAGSGSGIYCYDNGGVTLSSLIITGSGASSDSGNGIYFNTNSANYSALVIKNCTISGFGSQGIALGNYNNSGTYANVTITGCNVFSNGGHGMNVSHCNTLSISGCTCDQNTGYSGIDLNDCNGAVVQNCTCYDNSDIGLWDWDSNNVVFEHDTAYGNGGGDGGFDLDVGSTNCTIEYCSSYNNGGEGYEICGYSGNPAESNLTIRYNISENDGYPIAFLADSAGGCSGLYVYNNTIYNAKGNTYFSCFDDWGPTPTPFVIANNVVDTPTGSDGDTTPTMILNTGTLMNYDDYYSLFSAYYGSQYNSLSSFQSGTGEEANAVNANPAFSGTPGTDNVNAYTITAGSPIATAGVNMSSYYGINPGTTDYYGNPLPVNGPYSIGAAQASGVIANGNHTLTPQSATGSRLDAAASGTANGTAVDLWGADGGSNQTWTFTNEGGNVYKIQPSYDTSLCLDVIGGGGSGAYVDLWTDNGGSNQRWSVTQVSGDIYTLSPLCASGSCLDVYWNETGNGTPIDIYNANGGANQNWAIP